MSTPIQFPPGYEDDLATIVRQCRHPQWRELDRRGEPVYTAEGRYYRRWLTRTDPVRFWLTYLGPYFTDQTSGVISFCGFHLDAAAVVAGWAQPGPDRHAFVAWRQAGKSTCFNLGGLLFGLAQGYIRFPYLFSLNAKMAAGKLNRILTLLRGQHPCSRLLLADFPELALIRSSAGRYELRNGAIISAHGMLGETLGEVGNEGRPDALMIDDPQPKAGKNNEEWVRKGKDAIRTGILPMGKDAKVILAGTVTMIGDLMDDVVQLAHERPGRSVDGDRGQWLAAERFTCHYHPVDWPQQHPPEKVAAQREAAMTSPAELRAYALSYEPHLLGTEATAQYFPPPGGWQYGPVGLVGQRILVIDEAYSKRTGADQTAFAVMSADTSRQRISVDHVEAGRWSLPEKQAKIHELCRWAARELDGPPVSVILIEAVRDGEHAVEALGPYPTGTTPVAYPVHARKSERIELLHKRYVARGVRHRTRLDQFEAQAQAWTPRATRDDMLDAVSAGERFLRTGRADM